MSITVLSLGAGVQSTCVLLMAEHGEIERPDEAIFADTGWEPAAVYTHLEWLRTQTTIPITVVSAGNLREMALRTGADRFISIPTYIAQDGQREGMGRRQCTREFKVTPIRKRVAALRKERGAAKVRQLFGISLDEVTRMRQSDVQYIEHVYPLVDLRMTRHDCLLWMERHGYPRPPKSACIGCPYHDDRRWRDMRDNHPTEWAYAVSFDADIRRLRTAGKGAIRGVVYLHKTCVPLAEVDLSTAEERGQLSLFDAECMGMCGL